MPSPRAPLPETELSPRELAQFRWEIAKRETPWIAGAGDINAQKWPGAVTVGRATTGPSVRTFEALMRHADQDMYARRAQLRAQESS
ncbi:MAG: hypothetical protein Q7L55_00810 [Actinomycetota bacterium]|nr:hypothetical protein [Actinomycetota bacterium]